MILEPRLSSLRERHAALDTMIKQEERRPAHDSLTLRRLKLEKLYLKEQIERLSH